MNVKKVLKQEAEKLSLQEEVKNKQVTDYIVSVKLADGHIHNVLPDSLEARNELVTDLMSYITKPTTIVSKKDPPEKIVFKNRQAFGDILTFTCAVRDFKKAFPNTEVGVISTAMHIWDHNPYINHQLKDQENILDVGPGFLTNKSNMWNLHMANAFRVDIENKTGLSIPQGAIRPDIWMTEEEYNRPPLIEGPYWLFIYGGEPGWPAKQYHRWQEVINILKDDIQIVQLGMRNHPYPLLENVIDYIGKTEDKNSGIRNLFNLFLHSQGSLGLVSMHMHLSAAFNNPCVVVAGAREPAWFTNYFGHQYIETNGTMFCSETNACWACKMEACKNKVDYGGKKIPKCVSIIEPDEIAEAVRKYYKGGRLEYGKKIPNTFFKNITKESKVFITPKPDIVDDNLLSQYGFKWGGDSITDRDWMFMKDVLQKENVRNVLEFGAGLSTLLMGTIVDKIITYESIESSVNKIKPMANPEKHSIYRWNGKDIKVAESDPHRFDLAFVDGPPGGKNREWSTKYASEVADRVIVHDAGRTEERKWQTKYLQADFEMVSKGGHRCHYWKRKKLIEPVPLIEELKDGKPTMKMVTTCRGYGGSERSTIEIMRMFLSNGFNVELVSTSNISGEYRKNIPEGVLISKEFERVTGPCDILVLYASDTIWNYNKDQYIATMNRLKARRKIMVLNFKIGGAGQVEWTKGWDKYLFLSSDHEGEILRRMPGVKTAVMAPPTSLDLFLQNTVNYSFPLRLIRHSSQGDSKYPENMNEMVRAILRVDSSIEFHFMPSYSKLMDHPQIYKYQKNKPPVWHFLRNGNCFWYALPPGYTEGGPKVVMEAMASGIPVICDNHSGMKDRVNEETGWLCDKWEDYIEVIKYILNNPNCIMEKGIAAREYAKNYFIAENWVKEIIE